MCLIWLFQMSRYIRACLLCLQYAGNVLVYGAMHPSDGDWFGGLNADNAEQFLDALVNIEVGGGEGLRWMVSQAGPTAGSCLERMTISCGSYNAIAIITSLSSCNA